MQPVRVHTPYRTKPNSMGVYKIYPNRPTHDPDNIISLDDLCDSTALLTPATTTTLQPASPLPSTDDTSDPKYAPFLSASVARLMCWFHNGSIQKSVEDLDRLVHNVILQDDFRASDLQKFSTKREHERLDKEVDSQEPGEKDSPFSRGWNEASVKIRLPGPGSKQLEQDTPEFEVKGVIHRPLLDVIKEAFEGPNFDQLHTTPFELRWDPSKGKAPSHPPASDTSTSFPPDLCLEPLEPGHQHLYGEMYNSPAMLEEHNKLPHSSPLEPVVVGLMPSSDSTCLAQFGVASAWPIYTYLANQSKYVRAQPTSGAAHHQAYIPSLPDTVTDEYRRLYGKPPTAPMLTHLKRELMHAVWDLLLSPEFIHAYVNGIVVRCKDGVERLLFPRFFTYSADYPEKCVADHLQLTCSSLLNIFQSTFGHAQILWWVPMSSMSHQEGSYLRTRYRFGHASSTGFPICSPRYDSPPSTDIHDAQLDLRKGVHSKWRSNRQGSRASFLGPNSGNFTVFY